jgi:hypothetical protein
VTSGIVGSGGAVFSAPDDSADFGDAGGDAGAGARDGGDDVTGAGTGWQPAMMRKVASQ